MLSPTIINQSPFSSVVFIVGFIHINMVHKVSLRPLVLILCLSYVLSPTRSLKSNKGKQSLVEDLLAQDALDLVDGDDLVEVGEVYFEGRQLMESTDDYPGPGANNHHDPKPPGRT
ncbi:hypothetical protein CFOL_v3_27432 [Cephalotus follicularis]|uniref:Uncharacterized protein n=1 Tax=Cephalotus follicularis TaxID=3775 RepID=A0A1Q3CUS9_CEPFO|nr:hypothetical protein CFOL_v3_27432 [Cephalotus follicularis]